MNRKPFRHPPDRSIRISKTMSKILRHSAKKDGVPIDVQGFVLLDDLFNHKNIKSIRPPVTESEIRSIVSNCQKQRFSLREDEEMGTAIRANQGHSITIEKLDLTPFTREQYLADDVCVHGTNYKSYESISKTGLSRMKRTHIHCAAGLPGDDGVISGMRTNSRVLIFVSTTLALDQNIPFFVSSNNVLLSPGNADGLIPVSCFARVQDRKTGKLLLEKDPKEIERVRLKLMSNDMKSAKKRSN